MKVQTSFTYEKLATALKLDPDLDIDLVEVDRLYGLIRIVVSGKVPSRTITEGGFSPSGKRVGCEPDHVALHHLIKS